MSSWAGIESGSNPPPTPASSSAPAATSHSEPVAQRRMRRQQRPIIGSLDGAGTIVQHNLREVVLGAAWILLPGVGLTLAATSLAFDRYQSFKGSAVSVPELFGGGKASSGIEQLLWYLGLVITSLGASLVGGYVATLVVRRQVGLPLRISTAYRSMLPRLPSLIAAWAIGHCWFPLVALLLANTSGGAVVAAALLGAPLVLVAATMTAVVSPVIVVERLGPLAGLRRGWILARRNFGLLFGFVLGSAMIGLLVQYGIAYLPRLLQATRLLSFGRFGWLIEGVSGQLGRLISTPLIAVATALVYLELRMTREGMDIVLEADRAFGPVAIAPGNGPR